MKGIFAKGYRETPKPPGSKPPICYNLPLHSWYRSILGWYVLYTLGPQQPMESWRFFVPSKYGCTKQRLKMKETWVPRVLLKTRIFSFLPPEKLPNLRWVFCSSTRGLLWRGFQVEHIATFSQLRSHHWWDSTTFLGWLILMGSIIGKYCYIYIHIWHNIHMIYIYTYTYIYILLYTYIIHGSYGFCILGFALYWWFFTDSAIVRSSPCFTTIWGRIPSPGKLTND